MNKIDVKHLMPNDPEYPESVRAAFGGLLPPEIWYIGDIEILNTKTVGFCGSRNASEYGLQIAADCASQLAAVGVTVVSGYAPGVDMASHEAALISGGRTIIVLPEGIDRFRIKKSVVPVWDWRRVLVISHFPRNAIWRAHQAMDRNKIIVALSRAVIVLEARETGGTLNAGHTTLRMKKPLFVAMYDDMNGSREGNHRLISAGGVPLKRNRSSNHARLRDVLGVLGISSDSTGREASMGS
jgi:DNA processing protein